MRKIFIIIGYFMIFLGLLLSMYDGIISFKSGSNQFHSVIKMVHYFQPGFINPFRFGFNGKEFVWTDILVPMFDFPVCVLLLLVGIMFARLNVRLTAF